MNPKLKELIDRPNYYKVDFLHENVYGTYIVSCRIERDQYRNELSVLKTGPDEEEALDNAIELFNKVKGLKNIKTPGLDEQKAPGYKRVMLDEEIEIEFKRNQHGYDITDLRRKSGDFYYVEKPFPVTSNMKFKEMIKENVYMYTTNNIRALSGSAHTLIVENGMVVKTRMDHIS